MTAAVALLVAIVAVEVALRSYRSARHAVPWWGLWKLPSPKSLAFAEHPYALYVKRPNSDGFYPSNTLGYTGKREVASGRSAKVVRIYCVGGSTMEAHDPAQGPDSSWPAKLQDLLATRCPEVRIECINAASAGYTSAESLSEFLFRGLELRPDVLLVYHNVNDAWTCQMIEGFKSDYSHARRHKPWRIGWINRIPQLPWLWTYQALWRWATQRFGKANALIHWIADPPWTAVRAFNPSAVAAFARNITNLACVARAWDCVPVLVKWECDWAARRHPTAYYRNRGQETTDRYFEFLEANNEALAQVASRVDGCEYIDVGPFASEHFADGMHFSPQGLQTMAHRVADSLEPIVRSRIAARATAQERTRVPVGSAHGR